MAIHWFPDGSIKADTPQELAEYFAAKAKLEHQAVREETDHTPKSDLATNQEWTDFITSVAENGLTILRVIKKAGQQGASSEELRKELRVADNKALGGALGAISKHLDDIDKEQVYRVRSDGRYVAGPLLLAIEALPQK